MNHSIKGFFLLVFIHVALICLSQTGSETATTVLSAVNKKLGSLSSVRYNYVREMRYVSDNYESTDSARMYIRFDQRLPMGLKFQANSNRGLFIYDGAATLDIDNRTVTIDSALAPPKRIESNSFIYSSMASVRNHVVTILSNDSIYKILSDTLVNGRQLYCIRFEGPMMYLQSFKGIGYYNDSTLKRPNYLLVDKKTLLPYQFVQKLVHGDDDRDYIRVTFTEVQANPDAPEKKSWLYSSYSSKYKRFVEKEEVPLVATGAVLPAFNIPVYSEAGADSISMDALKGQVVLIEFWFKSCGPCIKALPHYNDLRQSYADSGFQLVTINIEDPVQDIAFFYKKYPPTYPMAYNGLALFESLGFSGCPSSVLVSREGKVVKTFFGFDEKLIRETISATL